MRIFSPLLLAATCASMRAPPATMGVVSKAGKLFGQFRQKRDVKDVSQLIQPGDMLPEAIVEVSQTSYPILKALTAETFVPFSAKIGKLVLDIAPDKLGKSIALRHGQSAPPLRCHSSIRSTGAP